MGKCGNVMIGAAGVTNRGFRVPHIYWARCADHEHRGFDRRSYAEAKIDLEEHWRSSQAVDGLTP
jgi:hypothetical protein